MELSPDLRGVLLRRAQCQGESVHAALVRRPELGRQGGVDGAGASHPVEALEGRADQQHAVVGLAASLGACVAGVLGAVVLDGQHDRREGPGQGCVQAVGSVGGGWMCHEGVIAPSAGRANFIAATLAASSAQPANQL